MAGGLVFDALRTDSRNHIAANLLLPTHITCLTWVGILCIDLEVRDEHILW